MVGREKEVMNEEELRTLLRRYADGTCTPEEKQLLERLVLERPMPGNWQWSSEEQRLWMGLRIKRRVDEAREARFPAREPRIKRWWPLATAAACLLLAGAGWLFWLKDASDTSRSPAAAVVVGPPDGIVLTLSDGSVVRLDDQPEGLVSVDAGVTLRKLHDGRMVYDAGTGSREVAPGTAGMPRHTLHIPKGKHFRFTLPDGTRVWLNTASSLSYPVAFDSREREVILEGEAYFEVVHRSGRPFRVTAGSTTIHVTGTQFNIAAYADEGMVTTTLVEGGVFVEKGGARLRLSPGEQAITYHQGDRIGKYSADIPGTLAWQKDYFLFNDRDIRSIMTEVARWYDIDVVYRGDPPDKKIGGSFPRSARIEDLLKDLAALGNMKFKKQGKEVVIMP